MLSSLLRARLVLSTIETLDVKGIVFSSLEEVSITIGELLREKMPWRRGSFESIRVFVLDKLEVLDKGPCVDVSLDEEEEVEEKARKRS